MRKASELHASPTLAVLAPMLSQPAPMASTLTVPKSLDTILIPRTAHSIMYAYLVERYLRAALGD